MKKYLISTAITFTALTACKQHKDDSSASSASQGKYLDKQLNLECAIMMVPTTEYNEGQINCRVKVNDQLKHLDEIAQSWSWQPISENQSISIKAESTPKDSEWHGKFTLQSKDGNLEDLMVAIRNTKIKFIYTPYDDQNERELLSSF